MKKFIIMRGGKNERFKCKKATGEKLKWKQKTK